MRTLIQSEKTFVPPVTAERSPPDSRMTGADSPVIADSSTDATPSMISPSPGINSPASTKTTSSFRRSVASTIRVFAVAFDELGGRFVLAFRSVSACALPRPSAIASAKLANKTVNHSHRVICSSNAKLLSAEGIKIFTRSLKVKNAAPTSTTNITGFFSILRGFSFLIESIKACVIMFPSQIEIVFLTYSRCRTVVRRS